MEPLISQRFSAPFQLVPHNFVTRPVIFKLSKRWHLTIFVNRGIKYLICVKCLEVYTPGSLTARFKKLEVPSQTESIVFQSKHKISGASRWTPYVFMLWVRDRIYLRMPWMRSLVHMSSIFQSLVHAFGPHLSNQFKLSRNDILTLSHTGQTWSNTTNNVLNKPDLKVSTPFIFPSVDAALPPWSTTAWPGKWQHEKGVRFMLKVISYLDNITIFIIFIHEWWRYFKVFQCISSILDCLAAQSRWQLCIWSDAPKCCLGFQDLSISWPCWSSWSRKLNSITKRIVGYTSVSGALQIHCVCTWLPLASRLKCYLSSLIHVQSGCYPSNPEHERKRAKTVINHTTTWSNSEQFASNLKRGRNIVNDWRSCKSGRATSKDISKWRNWHHNITVEEVFWWIST